MPRRSRVQEAAPKALAAKPLSAEDESGIGEDGSDGVEAQASRIHPVSIADEGSAAGTGFLLQAYLGKPLWRRYSRPGLPDAWCKSSHTTPSGHRQNVPVL